jgi:glucose/arabinose dehydrogenase
MRHGRVRYHPQSYYDPENQAFITDFGTRGTCYTGRTAKSVKFCRERRYARCLGNETWQHMYRRIPGHTIAACLVAMAIAACGGSSGSGGLGPTPPPPPPPPPPPEEISVVTERVFPAVIMQAPVAMLQAPADSDRWFLVEQQGLVRVFPNVDGVTNQDVSHFLDIRTRVLFGGEQGLLGMAFHPDFGIGNFEVFVSYTRSNGGQRESVVSRFRSLDNGLTLDASGEEIILTIPQPDTNHNGGHIAFGDDGFLYAGWGDGGAAGDPLNRAQDNFYLLGTFTRIDVDGDAPYEIPADNPFAINAATPCPQGIGNADCPEIFAYGFRNPWRWSFDRRDGDLWAGDVGQERWEEVDRVILGGNFGWRCREGTHDFNTDGCNGVYTDPVTEYDRAQGRSITGGYVYRGSAIPEMQGSYIYGDFGSGRVWAIAADSQAGVTGVEILGTLFSIASFAEDVDGEIYIVNYNGSAHRIIDAP